MTLSHLHLESNGIGADGIAQLYVVARIKIRKIPLYIFLHGNQVY